MKDEVGDVGSWEVREEGRGDLGGFFATLRMTAGLGIVGICETGGIFKEI
jgi:hypothetical protein